MNKPQNYGLPKIPSSKSKRNASLPTETDKNNLVQSLKDEADCPPKE